jgi:hypothetical protein
MTNALITTAPGWAAALSPQTTEDAWKIAQALAKSALVPKAYQGNPSDIIIAGAMGARLGLDIFSSLQSIACINGRPTLWGDGMLAVCQARNDWRGMEVKWSGVVDSLAAIVVVRRQIGSRHEESEGRFSAAEAKKAGLWGKQGPWTNYPQRMIEMRARSYALRSLFADALLGFHSREEMEDAAMVEVDATVHPQAEGKRRMRQVAPAFSGIPEVVDPLGMSAAEQAQQEIQAEREQAQFDVPEPKKDAPPADLGQGTATVPPVATDPAPTAPTAPASPVEVKPLGTPIPAIPTEAEKVNVPTLDAVRAAVNYAASGVGGSKGVVNRLATELGYKIETAASIKPEDRARAIKIANDLAGVQS